MEVYLSGIGTHIEVASSYIEPSFVSSAPTKRYVAFAMASSVFPTLSHHKHPTPYLTFLHHYCKHETTFSIHAFPFHLFISLGVHMPGTTLGSRDFVLILDMLYLQPYTLSHSTMIVTVLPLHNSS